MVSLVEELDGLIDGVLPQQRGLEPSTLAGPRDVETHVADAIAVLDHLGWERAWLIGHSWGGYLAMHIAVANPDRVAGLIAISTLGANPPDGGMEELNGNLVARLTPDERTALDPLLAREADGDDDPILIVEILTTLWPSYSYVHGSIPPPVPMRLERPLVDGPDTMTSVAAHFQAGTLERGLRDLDLPAFFLHGEGDPLPPSSAVGSAAFIMGARVQLIEECGHFPWIERPGVVRAAVEAFLREAS